MSKKPYAILFVCTGNICRSPTAEAMLRHRVREAKADLRFRLDSAGTTAFHEGEKTDYRSRKALEAIGVEMNDIRARGIQPSDFTEFDLILAMDRAHLKALKKMAPPEATARIELYLDYAHGKQGGEIPDPYYGTNQDFLKVVKLVDDATTALLKQFKQQKLL